MSEPPRVQSTGNPVLDTTANLAMALGAKSDQQIEQIHALVLRLAAREPGGLRRPAAMTKVEVVPAAEPSPADTPPGEPRKSMRQRALDKARERGM